MPTNRAVPTISTPLSSIARRAVLVDLSISCIGTARTDKRITKQTNDTHGIKQKMGRFTKHIIDPDAPELDQLRTLIRKANDDHDSLTSPWSKMRILGKDGLTSYKEKIGVHEAAYWNHVNNVLKPAYPRLVADAKAALNGGFDLTQYCDHKLLELDRNAPRWKSSSQTNEFDAKFGFAMQVSPVATANDWRLDMEADELETLRNSYEQYADGRIKDALGTVWDRLQEKVEHMIDRLKTYGKPILKDGVETGKTAFFLDTLVSNVTELLDIVPLLNVSGDPEITKVADAMRTRLTSNTPETLRTDEKVREETTRRAEEILHQITRGKRRIFAQAAA